MLVCVLPQATWLRVQSPYFRALSEWQLRPVVTALTLQHLHPGEQMLHTDGRLYVILSGTLVTMEGACVCTHCVCVLHLCACVCVCTHCGCRLITSVLAPCACEWRVCV